MGKVCAVPKCNKLHKTIKRSMFKVPSDEIERKKWAAAMPEIKNLKASHFICENHFDTAFIHRKYVKYDENGKLIAEHVYQRPQLAPSAIPNTPANVGCENTVPVNTDIQSCVPTMLFSINPLHSALPVPPSAAPRNCTSISGIDPSPMNIDVEAAESSSLHGSSDIVEELEKSNDIGARNRSEEKPDKMPRNESFVVNFRELKISPASLSLEESRALTIPKSWTVSELATECRKKMIFSYIITLPVTDATPALKKSVTLDLWSGQIYYFVHGTILNLDQDRPLLPLVLNKIESLPNILLAFEHMRVCEGIKPIDTSFMKDDGIKDVLNYWRSNNCLLLTKYRKCAECKRVQNVFKQRQVRYLKNPAVSRIRHASNSLDQNKINALKKKLIRERKMKNRAKYRLKLLNEELEKNQQDLAAIQNTSFEKKCEKLNLCGTQKMAVQEIIAAAKTKGSGRRYSENWLMLCMLMNIRSPGYYDFLRKHEIIPLPSKKTIRNYFSLIDNKCGFDEKFAKILEKHFAAKPKMKRHRLLVLDEINL